MSTSKSHRIAVLTWVMMLGFSALWLTRNPSLPKPLLILGLISLLWLFIKPSVFLTLLSGPIVAVVNSNVLVQNLGDTEWLNLARDDSIDLYASSIGGHALIKVVSSSANAIQFVPPILGGITTMIVMSLVNVQSVSRHRLINAFAVVLGCTPIFSRGFVEVVPYAFPVAIASVLCAGALSEQSVSRRRLNIALFLALAAALIHGVFLLLLLCHVIVRLSDHLLAQNLREGMDIVLISAGFALVVFGWLKFWNIGLTTGDATGGGDSKILPPTITSAEHLSQTLSLFLVGSIILAFIWFGTESHILTQSIVGLSLYAGFLLLWNFDLGWRRDLDLVIAASVVTMFKNRPLLQHHWINRWRIPRSFSVVFLVAHMVLLAETDWIIA